MDEAIDLLEKQRKVYYKKGGSGEIGDIRRKLGDIEREIHDLIRRREAMEKEEDELAKINTELTALLAKKQEFLAAERSAGELRMRRSLERQYTEMKAATDSEAQALEQVKLFFKGGLPDARELDAMKEAELGARQILQSAEDEKTPEHLRLEAIFKEGPAFSEYEKIKGVREKLVLCRHSLQTQREEAKGRREALRAAPPDCTKSEALIQKISESKPKNVNICWYISIAFFVVSLITGAALGMFLMPILYILCGIGLFGIICSAAFIKHELSANERGDAYREAKEYLVSLGRGNGVSDDEILNSLYEIRAEARDYSRSLEACRASEAKCAVLETEIRQLTEEITEFLSALGIHGVTDVEAMLDSVFKDRELYLALEAARNAKLGGFEQKRAAAQLSTERVRGFLAKYPTRTNRPFDEISAKILEYEALTSSLSKMRQTMNSFAREHGIDPGRLSAEDNSLPKTPEQDPELDFKISQAERTKILLERSISGAGEELERLDELTAERDSLAERAAEYEKRLDTILKTRKFLEEAKDSLTSKYLSKTKASFDRYVSLIGSEGAEDFVMDTSFAVMKNERGTLRSAEAYSRGTRDLYALAARLALVDSLYEGEAPFILLDDPFCHFDDAKFKRAAAVITALGKERQIIYLTCSDSRKI
jgi:uncharacterized protein YhaN